MGISAFQLVLFKKKSEKRQENILKWIGLYVSHFPTVYQTLIKGRKLYYLNIVIEKGSRLKLFK
jgi:hypothetical protein